MIDHILTVTVALACAAAGVQVAPDDDPPADAVESESTQGGGVSDTLLRSAEGQRVVISAHGKGPIYRGTLKSIGADVVVLLYESGDLVEIDKSAIEQVALVRVPQGSTPPPAAEPATVRLAMCMGDDSCDSPRKCISGECRLEPGYVDDLEEFGHARVKHGKRAMIAGGSVAAFGLLLVPIGLSVGNRADRAAEECDDEFDDCTSEEEKAQRGYDTWITGLVFVVGGGLTTLLGAAYFSAGKKKLKRAKRYRRAGRVSLSLTGDSVGLRYLGRF